MDFDSSFLSRRQLLPCQGYAIRQSPGQLPLRSRQFPLGLTTLSPESRSKVRSSNFSLEVASWFAEQILRFFLLVFPEDFGGDGRTGPASPWSAREFTDLSDAVEAQRHAVYLCRFAGAEYRRSVWLLTNLLSLSSDMYLGWPSLSTLDSVSQYVGLLPTSCACSTTHPSLQILSCPDARSTVSGPHLQQDARLSASLFP